MKWPNMDFKWKSGNLVSLSYTVTEQSYHKDDRVMRLTYMRPMYGLWVP